MISLDLFTGIGGLTEALKDYAEPICYCENDTRAIGILASRMQRGEIPNRPIWGDIRTLRGKDFPCRIDLIVGGFPCQDISCAGRGEGLEGERSGLFFQIVRLARELRPQFVFLENVPAITTRGLQRIISEWSKLGYDCRWTLLSAAAVGAPHIRQRWWLLAHDNGNTGRVESRGWLGKDWPRPAESLSNGQQESMADSESSGRRPGLCKVESAGKSQPIFGNDCRTRDAWSFEPDVGRVAHGVPLRNNRLHCLGNSVVPQCAREAFETLAGIKKI